QAADAADETRLGEKRSIGGDPRQLLRLGTRGERSVAVRGSVNRARTADLVLETADDQRGVGLRLFRHTAILGGRLRPPLRGTDQPPALSIEARTPSCLVS